MSLANSTLLAYMLIIVRYRNILTYLLTYLPAYSLVNYCFTCLWIRSASASGLEQSIIHSVWSVYNFIFFHFAVLVSLQRNVLTLIFSME